MRLMPCGWWRVAAWLRDGTGLDRAYRQAERAAEGLKNALWHLAPLYNNYTLTLDMRDIA